MATKLMTCVGLLASVCAAHAQTAERTAPVPLDSPYVPVNLNALANSRSTPAADSAEISVNKIPFDLAQRGENNNLFLHNAGWPDWKEDPLSFYAAYDTTPKEPTDTLPVVQIPADDYSAVYVLASCENAPEYSDILSLRIGAKQGSAQTTYHDFEFKIPRAGEKTGANVVRVLPAASGNIFLLRLPLNAALSQEFSNHRALDVEITKKIRLSVAKPDAARFQYRPLGLPSGVHLYGMTFERAPLRLALRSTEAGHVFNEPQIPTFNLEVQGTGNPRLKALSVSARATDYYGNSIEFPTTDLSVGPLTAYPIFRRALQLPVPRRGYYALTVTVQEGDKVLLERQTTFALLPKDTRRHRETSPFGTWDFGGTHYTPGDSEIVGPLYVKAGLRYGMFAFSPAERRRYGVLKGNDPTVNARTDLSRLDEQIAKIKESGEVPQRWLLFHEDVISGNHVTRTPDLFTGKTYKLNAEEQAKFDLMTNIVLQSVPKIRKAFPNIKFYLGNGAPHLMEEFLRHKLPKETFDVLGNEAASFQRLPESQPTDFVANNPSMWMEHELLKAYGYADKGVEQGYEIMYPSSNPGNLTLRQQANYVVRNAMHSLAWKVPAIRFEGIADPGNSYYHSNWGGTGLMFGLPNLSPKPLYVATATTTQQLDGAKFSRIIPTGTTTLYAFEFQKPDGQFVTCIWTPNASQQVWLQASRGQLVVTDLMSNQRVLPLSKGRAALMAGADPVFVESARPLKLEAGATVETGLPPQEYSIISPLDDVSQWEILNGENDELEAYNFMQPRRKGSFEFQNVASFGNRSNVLQAKPMKSDSEQWWLPEYSRLRMKQPAIIEGKPTHIGLMVNGNGGWGRIIFELEDAAGQRWISLGTEQKGEPNPWLADWLTKSEFEKLKSSGEQSVNEQSAGVSDWNSNDVWGRSMINFAGWRYMQFPLPGNYPGEGYHWPYTSQWRCVKADGSRGDYVVHYPLKFTSLAVTARSKVLYGTEVLPVQRPEIYLQDLGVSYGDPDKDFWQPDLGQR
jgi:hypothetical protein